MTAASAPTHKAGSRAGLWTFLRLLGGWASVAILAYLLGVPSGDFGWVKMIFAWVLLTLIADEFAGWFGYIGLALGALPFLHTPPEQWFTLFPLLFAALFALLLVKHSGGPLVVPFAALLFIGTIVGAEKLGIKMKIPLALLSNPEFRRAATVPMLAVMSFSFVRQLVSVGWRWQAQRRLVPRAPKPAAPAKAAPAVPAAPTTAAAPKPSGTGPGKTLNTTTVIAPPAPPSEVGASPSPGTSAPGSNQNPAKKD